MKVTLLGTSSAEGMPALFCRCATCLRARQEGGHNLRTRSSALIDDVLKIDFPPDTLSQVTNHGVDLSRVRAVLFTHGHEDHFSAPELRYRGSSFIAEPLDEPLRILGPRDVIEQLRNVLDPETLDFTLHQVEPGEPTSAIGYDIFPFLANHDESRTCLNYVLRSSNGDSLLYATDTGWYPEETWRMLEQFRLDGVVVECTKREDAGPGGHLSIPEVIRMRHRLERAGCLKPATPMIATHFCHQMGLLHDELEAFLRPDAIRVGYDGLTVEMSAWA